MTFIKVKWRATQIFFPKVSIEVLFELKTQFYSNVCGFVDPDQTTPDDVTEAFLSFGL